TFVHGRRHRRHRQSWPPRPRAWYCMSLSAGQSCRAGSPLAVLIAGRAPRCGRPAVCSTGVVVSSIVVPLLGFDDAWEPVAGPGARDVGRCGVAPGAGWSLLRLPVQVGYADQVRVDDPVAFAADDHGGPEHD